MNSHRLLILSMALTMLIGLMSPALAQTPKIVLDVEDLSGEAGHLVSVSVLIDNLEDSIAAFQIGLTFDRPDIMEIVVDTITDTCYECEDQACTTVVAYQCTLEVARTEVASTLTEAWDYIQARTFGGFDLRLTGIADTDYDGIPEDMQPGMSGVLFKFVAKVKCIPDTLQNRTVVLSISPINTFFSNAHGDLIEPLERTEGSVTVEPNGTCPHQGDIEPDGFITSIDLAGLISALFEGGEEPQDPCCPTSRFDMDCDGFLTSLDLSAMIDYLFSSGPGPCDPTTP